MDFREGEQEARHPVATALSRHFLVPLWKANTFHRTDTSGLLWLLFGWPPAQHRTPNIPCRCPYRSESSPSALTDILKLWPTAGKRGEKTETGNLRAPRAGKVREAISGELADLAAPFSPSQLRWISAQVRKTFWVTGESHAFSSRTDGPMLCPKSGPGRHVAPSD